MYSISKRLGVAAVAALLAAGCGRAEDPEQPAGGRENAAGPEAPDSVAGNPFFTESTQPFRMPHFDRIRDEHFMPAFERGMAEHKTEIEAIAGQSAEPTFENTMVAMEQSGRLLSRVSSVFFNLASADSNDARRDVRKQMAPKLSAHYDGILLDADLFRRIKTLHEKLGSMDLDGESRRLVRETYKRFVRAGAELSEDGKQRMKAINSEIAELQTQFSQNVLEEVNDSAVAVDSEEALAGLPAGEIEAAAEAAAERDLAGKYLITLQNTSRQPVLASLENRDLRKRIMDASLARGSRGGEYDNRAILARIVELRAERARLMGFEHHAAYSLQSQTARTAEAVNDRLGSLAPLAVANARREAADLQQLIDARGDDLELQSHDWAYYAEKLRQQRYAFDASRLKPYFELDNVLENGVFYAASRLYGISFRERTDLPLYHEDARVWEVADADGEPLALFIGDFYARESKRGGAWMNAYVSQSRLLGTKPVVANHQNIPKPAKGEPTLLTWDEVDTMFHEFGHALHGMFSDVAYPSFSGTSVPRDFVEYPSQVNEMWAAWPEVLRNYAIHHETGEPMPTELLDKVLATQKFNQGYDTTEYLAASLLDQAWHQISPDEVPGPDDAEAFERKALERAGVRLGMVPPRYRSTYFSHIVGGYSAGYYAYIWSEVLDADTVEWFKENGGLTRENGDHFRETLLSRGGAEDAMTLFTRFRGDEPDIRPLLERRGLVATGG